MGAAAGAGRRRGRLRRRDRLYSSTRPGGRRFTRRRRLHRDIQLPLAQSTQPAHARVGHAPDHHSVHGVCRRTPGRAHDSDGCAVTGAAGVPVTLSAPTQGAGGRFSAGDFNAVTVGADASGNVSAPTFTANGTPAATSSPPARNTARSLLVDEHSHGIPAQLARIPLEKSLASVGADYRQPLRARVLDAAGNPVAGATVSFTLDSASAGACSASQTAERELRRRRTPRRTPRQKRAAWSSHLARAHRQRRRGLVHPPPPPSRAVARRSPKSPASPYGQPSHRSASRS